MKRIVENITLGRLHRLEDSDGTVLIIVEHDGQDIRATFSQKDIVQSQKGGNEIIGIKKGARLLDATKVKNRHHVPVMIPKKVMTQIVEGSKNPRLLTRP